MIESVSVLSLQLWGYSNPPICNIILDVILDWTGPELHLSDRWIPNDVVCGPVGVKCQKRL